MPLPPFLLFAVTTGLSSALAARYELRTSPRPVPLTQGFAATMIYGALVVVPASVYFYAFHGDWFMLYSVDVQTIPSAVALLAFVGEGLLVGLGYLLGASLVRSQREAVVGVLLGTFLAALAFVIYFYRDRLALVGSFAQFHGSFGLAAYGEGALFQGSVVIGGIVLLGWAFLLARVWYGGQR